jgi:hypothetical protein
MKEGEMLRRSDAWRRWGVLVALALAAALPLAAAPAPGIIPAGTVIDGVLQSDLNSATSKPGDRFSLVEKDRLTQKFESVFTHHPPVLHGASIEGHVETAKPAGMGRNATLDLVFDDVMLPDGRVVPVHGQLVSVLRPQTHHLRNASIILAGTVAGHYVSKRTGVKHGALAGAAAATAFVLASKSNIVVPHGTVLRFKLTQPVNLAAAAASGAAAPSGSAAGAGTAAAGAAVAAGDFIGNRRTHVYHASNCPNLPASQNRVIFHSQQDAKQAGYRADPACVKGG